MNDTAFPDALPAQHRLHWYSIERVLGQGGFGITYLARDGNLDQSVAIKEYLPTDVATRRPDCTVRSRTDDQNERYRWGLERFIREARTLARFDHPNIVRVHSVFEFNNTAYMVMRFEEGETLAALLERRHSLPEKDLVRLLLPILDGLELVHSAGFIHRDIKPDNIHVRPDGSSVLLDFGSARHALGHSRTLTILVAPGYAPFEQYYSDGENQGPWTDIYGLGATCYRAIAGHAPMDAIARSKGILGSTKEMLLPAAVAGNGRYSEPFLKAVDHALQFAEVDRPQSIAEWRKALIEGAAADKTAARPVVRAGEDAPSAAAARPGWPGARAPMLWASAGAAAVIIAIAVLPLLSTTAPKDDLRESVAQLQKKLEEDRKHRDSERAEERSRLDGERQRQDAERQRQEAEKQSARQVQESERQRLALERAREAKPPAGPRGQSKPGPIARAEPAPLAIVPQPAPPAVIAPAPEAKAPPPPQLKLAPAPEKRLPGVDLLAKSEDAFARHDTVEGIGALQEAARLGNIDAQMRLADRYASGGRGVPQSYNQAYVWYGSAARGGNTEAAQSQERIAGRLQPAEIAQANKVIETLLGSQRR